MSKRHHKKLSLTYPDVVSTFMIFEDSKNGPNSNLLENLMDAVEEVEVNFDEDIIDDE